MHMVLDSFDQIIATLQRSKHVLLTTAALPNGDGLGSVLALYHTLKRMNKKVTIAVEQVPEPHKHVYDFLPAFQDIATEVTQHGELHLDFDLKGQSIAGLTYQVHDDTLSVRIVGKENTLTLDAPHIHKHAYPYDAIVVLDTTDLEALGTIYEQHTEFFYHTPVINIDHQTTNEHFGELNAIEFTASSTTEILYALLQHWKQPMDHHISTCLLTGIIHESKSFQKPNITPHTLAIAGKLIESGAQRERIVGKLFNNKPVKMLQIWGRALAHLKTDPETGMVWSVIHEQDFNETNTSEQELYGVVEDMLTHAVQARVVLLAYPRTDGWHIIVHTHLAHIDLRTILSPLNPHGSRSLVEIDIMMKRGDDAMAYARQLLMDRWPQADPMPEY